MRIIDNSNNIHERDTLINKTLHAKEVETFDLTTLYNSIEQPDQKKVITIMIYEV